MKEIQAKSIISRNSHPSSWFGTNYTMNVYRGCTHGCIYCDSRSECYQIENFEDIIIKINAPRLLEQRLSKMRKRATIGSGSMSDPYIPVEKKYKLTRECLEIIDKYRFRVHLCTKSNLILRDIDILEKIAKRYASVAFTITTLDEELAKIIEPNAPKPIERLEAMGILSQIGVVTGITMMPQLPYIMETKEHLERIIHAAKDYGAKFIMPAFGVTLRDRQREYYYSKIDESFKGLSEKYKKRFKLKYSASCINYKKMQEYFTLECKKLGISTDMPSYEKYSGVTQLSYFDKI